jgi:hypothetical protein
MTAGAPQRTAISLRALRFVTLLLNGLALTMESAHVLELPQKWQYDAAFYARVNGSLYRYFAVVGGAYQVGGLLLGLLLLGRLRGRQPAATWTAAGMALLAAAFVVWLAAVAPVNHTVANAPADALPALWSELRLRWELGHAAGFVLQVAGFAALLVSVLVETPRD